MESAPMKDTKETKPILKRGNVSSKQKKRSRIVWDEDNLAFNEENKSATMKIDEPPTPYNRDYNYIEDEEGVPKSPAEGERQAPDFSELESAMQKVAEKETKGEWDSSSEREESSESEGERNKDFEEKRKGHYNEFLLLKKLREQGKLDDDDEEEEDKKTEGTSMEVV